MSDIEVIVDVDLDPDVVQVDIPGIPGPAGPKGDRGDRGEQGRDGPPGPPGSFTDVDPGDLSLWLSNAWI